MPHDPRVSRSRQLLQEALLRLLANEAFQNISVSDITKQAKLNRGTFYLHYTDKYDLLNQTARDVFGEMLSHRFHDQQPTYMETIKLLTLTTCDFLQTFLRNCYPLNKPFEPMIEAQIQNLLYEYLLVWLSRQKHAELMACEATTATVISFAILGTCLRWSKEKTNQSAEQISNQITVLMMDGLWKTKSAIGGSDI